MQSSICLVSFIERSFNPDKALILHKLLGIARTPGKRVKKTK